MYQITSGSEMYFSDQLKLGGKKKEYPWEKTQDPVEVYVYKRESKRTLNKRLVKIRVEFIGSGGSALPKDPAKDTARTRKSSSGPSPRTKGGHSLMIPAGSE